MNMQREEDKVAAEEKGELPFLILLTALRIPITWVLSSVLANLAGPTASSSRKRRASGLTATVARTSAGALELYAGAKVTNLAATIEDLKTRPVVRLRRYAM